MLTVHSTKAFVNLACAHAQFFDKNEDGTPGNCAALHGYDRTVKLTFSGVVDENGWLVAFGKLKEVKSWLEYYFDHTTVLPANDPRINIPEIQSSLLATLRILPYGVSMEMSSLFIWEHVNPYIKFVTNGRAYVSRVESIEHERNSAFIEMDQDTAWSQARHHFANWKQAHIKKVEYEDFLLPKKETWYWENPRDAINRINGR